MVWTGLLWQIADQVVEMAAFNSEWASEMLASETVNSNLMRPRSATKVNLYQLPGGEGEQVPVSLHAFQLVWPPVFELELRTHHKVSYGTRYEDLAWLGSRHHPRRDVNANARDVVTA